MKAIIFLAAAALAGPAAAQPGPARGDEAATAPVDAERLALARETARAVWPDGTYARLTKGSMDQMMDSVMASMMDMKVTDLVPASIKSEAGTTLANSSFRDVMMKEDPAFQERARIINHVMMEEMAGILAKLEPDVREGLARAYARKFTAAQLADINRFMASPTGQTFASELMVSMMDPEVMSRVTKGIPEMMQAMPRILEKVEKATAHLPPPAAAKKAR